MLTTQKAHMRKSGAKGYVYVEFDRAVYEKLLKIAAELKVDGVEGFLNRIVDDDLASYKRVNEDLPEGSLAAEVFSILMKATEEGAERYRQEQAAKEAAAVREERKRQMRGI
ncbi:MAG: hypothetical protein LBT22_09305 [Peptococcaceae bacterium]|jgi:hypothetical protein|nr:hypothetical protein [Peptococcaceae bacterium]